MIGNAEPFPQDRHPAVDRWWEHEKFVTSLLGNMGREIVGDIEVDS